MKTIFIGHWIVAFTFILLVSLAEASELKSDELNYIIKVPDHWAVDFQNSAGFSIVSADHKKSVTLLVHNVGSAVEDSNFSAEFERGLRRAGSHQVSSKSFTVDGVPAYETVQSVGKAPYASSYIVHSMTANRKLYQLQAMHSGGDVTRDVDIQEALTSFHFLRPLIPSPPSGSKSGSPGLKLAMLGVIIVVLIFGILRRRARIG